MVSARTVSFVERLGHVRCIRFKSDIARESKYEESGGKAI